MRAVFWFLVGALVIPFPLSAEWRVTGRIGGLITAVAAHGSFAYVAVGSRVNVYDVTDPAVPREIGSTAFFADDVTDILVDDSRAYIAAGTDGIYIVDISDRTAPRVIGRWDSPGTAEGIARDGSWIYVADGPFGLRIVDASDPATPRPVGSAFDTRFAFDVAVRDHYAFVAAADAGLLVVDVADRDNLRELVVLDTPGYARDLAMTGTTLYVADQWGGVRVMSIATPFRPREIAAISLPSWAFAVTASGGTLHVADGARGFHTFDVSDPAHPLEAGTHPMTQALSWKVAVSNGRAFGGVRTQSVLILDVTQPATLRQVGRIAPLIRAGWVATRGDVAYVSTGEQDIRVIDIRRPERMRERGAGVTLNGSGGPIVAIGNEYVYIATGVATGGRVDVYDVRNPDQPAHAGSLRLNFPQELIASGSLLYVPDEFGLQVVDISNPASPAMKGTIVFPPDNFVTSGATSVAVAGQYAFVSAGRNGLKVVDVSDPAKMSIAGSWSGSSVSQLAYRDGFLYAATGALETELVVFDVADPRQPVRIGSTSLPGRSVGDVLLDGSYAYVANGGAGVVVIDIRNPEQPFIVAQIGTPGFATHLAMEGGRLFVTASNGGLAVVEQTAQQPIVTAASGSRIHAQPFGRSPANLPRVPPPSRQRSTPSPVIANSGRSVVVTSAADSGPGTLREALTNHAAGDVITFDPAVFPPTSPVAIQVATVLPHIKRAGVIIDASNAGVILDGSKLSGEFESGLEIEYPSEGNIIRGLQILNFPSCGIFIGGNGGNVIGGDRSRATGPIGEGNLLSRNRKAGILVGNPNGNRIVGNLIGTDASGRTALGQQTWGVNILYNGGGGTKLGGDRIGGYESWERNVIAGNSAAEISLHFAGSHSVIGNFIGTDVDGNALGAAFRAIDIDASSDNLITENVVVGNHAMQIIDSGACCNHIVRNWFGVTRDGRIIPRHIDGENGIAINESFNLIFDNVFGGIRYHSIFLTGQGGTVVEPIIAGNTFLGGSPTDASSAMAIGADAVSRMFVGGSTDAFRNSISGGATGIVLRQGMGRTFVLGNSIGVDHGAPLQIESAIDVGNSAYTFVQNNTVANISGKGVVVRAPTNRIRQNSIYGNQKGAIEVSAGAAIPALPVISTVTLSSVTGTSCAHCTVEIFSDSEWQSRWYEGTTTADATGAFSFTTQAILRGPNLTATSTDAAGSTSAISAPLPRPPLGPRRRAARH
jgi:hypothetical protein